MLNALLSQRAFPVHIRGYYLEAPLPDVFIRGNLSVMAGCYLSRTARPELQVVGFNEHNTLLSLIGQAAGLTLTTVIAPTGGAVTLTFRHRKFRAR